MCWTRPITPSSDVEPAMDGASAAGLQTLDFCYVGFEHRAYPSGFLGRSHGWSNWVAIPMTTFDETRKSRRGAAAKLALVAMWFSVLAPIAQAFAAELLPAQIVDPFRIICTSQGISVLPDSGQGSPEDPEAPETCAFCLVSSSVADSIASSALHVPASYHCRSMAAAAIPLLGRMTVVERARAPPSPFLT